MKQSVPMSAVAAAAALGLAPGLGAAPAPTNPALIFPWNSGTTVELSWDDNSSDEDAFEYEFYVDSTDDPPVFTSTTDFKGEVIAGLSGGGTGESIFFRVRALSTASGDSEWSPFASGTSPSTYNVAIQSAVFGGGEVGQEIAPVKVNFLPAAGVPSATGLPPGLRIDALAPGATFGSANVTGIPTEAGLFLATLSVTDGVDTASSYAYFRILPAPSGPVSAQALPEPVLPSDSPGTNLDLDPYFSDPDTARAATIETNHGPIHTILFADATPASVENFFDYADLGDYANTVFHRSATNASAGVAIIQSGWFKPDTPGNYTAIATQRSVNNEPGIPNDRGTLAIAKLGGAPNSGTSQWYFNTADNNGLNGSSNNGGFAVFGRAATPSLPVIDVLFGLPRATYSILLDGASRSIADFPTNQIPAGAVPAPEDLVTVMAVTEINRFVDCSLAGNSHPGVLKASIAGNVLHLVPAHPAAGGDAVLDLVATDLDGNALPATLSVQVRRSFAGWVAVHSLPEGSDGPGDDGEPDGVINALEYALGGDPTLQDAPAILPVGGRAATEGGDHLTITFSHLAYAGDLTYIVEKSGDLAEWIPVWESADGFAHDHVVEVVELEDKSRLTVRDPVPVTPGSQSHLRLRVEIVAPPVD